MTERTYMGDMGTNPLGTTNMRTAGVGDTRLMAIFPAIKRANVQLSINGGVSLPTGSTVQAGTMLMQDGSVMRMRLPYDMQLGSGTTICCRVSR